MKLVLAVKYREQSAGENIWTHETGNNRRLKKLRNESFIIFSFHIILPSRQFNRQRLEGEWILIESVKRRLDWETWDQRWRIIPEFTRSLLLDLQQWRFGSSGASRNWVYMLSPIYVYMLSPIYIYILVTYICIHVVTYICIHKGVQLKSRLPIHWELIGRSMTTRHVCYRAAVFFRHLRQILFLSCKEQFRVF